MKITQQESPEDREFIRNKVIEHNRASLAGNPAAQNEQVGFFARNDAGDIIGGITGTAYWGNMHIDFLWVDPASRGQRIAEQLMQQIEQHAKAAKYGLMMVDTFSFQAPEFYKKQGFQEFGVLENHPAGHSHHYFAKQLTE